VPSDTANVLRTQPEDGEIFAALRGDIPASSSLFAAAAAEKAAGVGRPGKFGVSAHGIAERDASGTQARIPDRTASQSICVS
jgi:hypothetical protein